jgi:SAM-dependent methyltransferase
VKIRGKSLQQIGRELLPGWAFDFIRDCWGWFDPGVITPIERFVRAGAAPHSPGYTLYRTEQIRNVLGDADLIGLFASGQQLPDGYGIGLDERCVEYPWFLANLDPAARRILDAGSTLNHEFLLDTAVLRTKRLHILTLAPEDVCFWRRGVSYLYDDLRDIPTRDHYYDAVACLSTLEHVGFDNSAYGALRGEADRDAFVEVMKELRRVLKPGGWLYLTVPFGRYEHHDWFQQFDATLLQKAIAAAAPRQVKRWFYRYTETGWQVSTEGEASHSRYVAWLRPDVLPKPVPLEPDRAAAARGLACVALTV